MFTRSKGKASTNAYKNIGYQRIGTNQFFLSERRVNDRKDYRRTKLYKRASKINFLYWNKEQSNLPKPRAWNRTWLLNNAPFRKKMDIALSKKVTHKARDCSLDKYK